MSIEKLPMSDDEINEEIRRRLGEPVNSELVQPAGTLWDATQQNFNESPGAVAEAIRRDAEANRNGPGDSDG